MWEGTEPSTAVLIDCFYRKYAFPNLGGNDIGRAQPLIKRCYSICLAQVEYDVEYALCRDNNMLPNICMIESSK